MVESAPGLLQPGRKRRSIQALGGLVACGIQQGLRALRIGVGFVVARMQCRPCFLQGIAGIGEPLGIMGKRSPLR